MRLRLGPYCETNLSGRVYGVQFIHPLHIYVLRVDIMPGVVLGAGDLAVNTRKSIAQGDYIAACVGGEIDNEQIINISVSG